MKRAEEVVEAQARVAQALSRARVSEDRHLTTKLREHGEQLVRVLVGLTRLRRIYAGNNNAFHAPSRELASASAALVGLIGPAEILAVEGQVYINDVRVRFGAEHDAGAELGRVLTAHGAAGLVIEEPLTQEQGLALGLVLSEPAAGAAEPAAMRRALAAALKEAGVPGVRLRAPQRVRYAGETHTSSDTELAEAYAQCLRVLTQLWQRAGQQGGASPLRFRRMIADLTGLALDSHLRQLALGAQDMKTPPYARHSLAVASLSLALGRAARLPADALSDLGLSGFFHDIGYLHEAGTAAVPHERHGVEGCLHILREAGFTTAKLRRALTALEHHRNHRSSPRPFLFARIVRIADDYDALTRVRGSEGRLLTPPDALARLVARAGRDYDPVLVQLFVNLMGRYPPGTILELGDRRWVVVVSGARSAETFERPLCMPLGKEGSRGEPIDLATLDTTVRVRG